MSHDHLCPMAKYGAHSEYDMCQCKLIERVRLEERMTKQSGYDPIAAENRP